MTYPIGGPGGLFADLIYIYIYIINHRLGCSFPEDNIYPKLGPLGGLLHIKI